MLDRLRATARAKLQRAVAEVVERQLARLHERLDAAQAENMTALDGALDRVTERLDAVNTDLTDRVRELGDRLHELENRQRRDVFYWLDATAGSQTAAFALEHMPKVPVFFCPHDTLRFALGEIACPGLALEFGVAGGTTLKIIADTVAGDRTVVGFDVFTGLPETWRTGFPAGEFAQERLPDIPGAELIVGLFDDTLPRFLENTAEPIAFVHLDVDLYSSSTTVLRLIADRLAPGAVLLFDEFFNFPGWQRHEYRAWCEFVAQTGRDFDYLAYTANNEQVVIRLH